MESEDEPESLIYGVGLNKRGELGLGHIQHHVPRPCPIQCVAVGVTLPDTGQGAYELCDNRSQIVASSCGNNFSVVAFKDGFVASCGDNESGQLGIGLQDDKMEFLTVISPLNGLLVQAISCGHDHTLLLTREGKLWAWGEKASGQLGIDNDHVCKPQQILALEELRIVEIAAGASHSMAICDQGNLFTFGSNIKGQLGIGFASFVDDDEGRATPRQASIQCGVRLKKCAGGGLHSLALTTDGVILGWGCNSFGQAGLLDEQEVYVPTAIHVQSGTADRTPAFTAISCGFSHSAALCSDGTIYRWGRSQGGVQDWPDPDNQHLKVATEVSGLRVNGMDSEIKCGADFTVVVNKHDGIAYAWGSGKSAKLGIVPVESCGQAEPVPCKLHTVHPRNMLQTFCAGPTARHMLHIFGGRMIWQYERILWLGLIKGDGNISIFLDRAT